MSRETSRCTQSHHWAGRRLDQSLSPTCIGLLGPHRLPCFLPPSPRHGEWGQSPQLLGGGGLDALCCKTIQHGLPLRKQIDQELLRNPLFAGQKLVTPTQRGGWRVGTAPLHCLLRRGDSTEEGASLGKVNAAQTQTQYPSIFIRSPQGPGCCTQPCSPGDGWEKRNSFQHRGWQVGAWALATFQLLPLIKNHALSPSVNQTFCKKQKQHQARAPCRKGSCASSI